MIKKKRLLILALLIALSVLPMRMASTFADSNIVASMLFQYQNLERGITVVPNGRVYSISENGYLRIFNTDGSVRSSVKLPSEYCGNLCSASDGTVFAHTFSDGSIYIFGPGSTSYKTVKAGTGCDFLATDSNGFLYNINNAGKSSAGKKATVIYRARIADVVALSSGDTITWDKTYQPEYTPPAGEGKDCYPAGLDVDSAGNAYIVDKGSYNGYDSSVSGIYKYNLRTGIITALRFSDSGNVGKLTWVHSVSADNYGNVAVVGRNSNMIAVFRRGSTIADALISVPGYCEDIDSDGNGDFVYGVEKNGTTSKNGVYMISMNNVGVSALTLSDSEKTLEIGDTFTLKASVTPDNATNKTVLFTSSDPAVASVTEDGVVKGLKEGSAVITAKTMQGEFSKECKVTVNKKEEPSSEADTNGQGTGSEGAEGTGETAGNEGNATGTGEGTPGGTSVTGSETAPTVTTEKVTDGNTFSVPSGSIQVTSVKSGTAVFTKANNAKAVTVPDTVQINGKPFKITQVNEGAFSGKKIRTVTIGKNVKVIRPKAFSKSKATKMIIKTKLLKKSKVRNSLKGSKIKTIQIKVGSKKQNKQYIKKYKKIFTKANAGKKVTVK